MAITGSLDSGSDSNAAPLASFPCFANSNLGQLTYNKKRLSPVLLIHLRYPTKTILFIYYLGINIT